MEIRKHKIGAIEIGIFSSSLMVLGLILWFLTLTFFGSNNNSEAKLLVAVGPSAGQVVPPRPFEKQMPDGAETFSSPRHPRESGGPDIVPTEPVPDSGRGAGDQNKSLDSRLRGNDEIEKPSSVSEPQEAQSPVPVQQTPTPASPTPVTALPSVAEMELQPPQPEPPRPEIAAVEPQPKEAAPVTPPQATPSVAAVEPQEPKTAEPEAASEETPLPSPPEPIIEFNSSSGRDPTLSPDEVKSMERFKKEAQARSIKSREKLVLRQRADDPFESLKRKIVVQGVLHTEGGIVAIVNNQIVSKGAEVMGAKILQILGNRVVFKYQNKIFEKNVKQ